MTKEECERIANQAAGPGFYPAWLYIGGPGKQGAGNRLVAAFVPCTVPKPFYGSPKERR